MSLDSHRIAQVLCRPGSRVLDVGCGPGVVAQRFVDIGCDVVGLDIAPESVTAMAERGLVAHLVDLDNGDLGEALGSDSFDVIVCLDVLEHTKAPSDVLGRLLEFLRPGGDVIISLPNVTHGDVRLTLLSGRFEYRNEGLLDATHLRFFDRESVEQLVSKAGLVMHEFHPVVFGVGETELGIELSDVAPDVLADIEGDPDSTIYQWVFRASPSGVEPVALPFVPLLEELAEVRAAQLGAEDYVRVLEEQLEARVDAEAAHKDYVAQLEREITDRDAYLRDIESRFVENEEVARREMTRLEERAVAADEDVTFVRRELDATKDVVQLISDENDHANAEVARMQAEVAVVSAELHAVKSRRLYRILDLLSRSRVVRFFAR